MVDGAGVDEQRADRGRHAQEVAAIRPVLGRREVVVEQCKLPFDHLGGADRRVGVEPESFEYPRTAAAHAPPDRMSWFISMTTRLQFGDDVVDVEHHVTHGGHFGGQRCDLVARSRPASPLNGATWRLYSSDFVRRR